MEQTTNFPEGFYVDRPSENAPDFVKCKLSVQVDRAVEWLQANKNEKGYVNIDMLNSRENKLYLKFNDFKPEAKKEVTYPEGIDPASVPF